MIRRNAKLVAMTMLLGGCAARVIESNENPIGASPNSDSGGPIVANGAGGSGTSGAGGGAGAKNPPKYPRPIYVDAAPPPNEPPVVDSGVIVNPGAGGSASVPTTDGRAGPPTSVSCAVPIVPEAPGTGNGTTSGCAPKTCAGFPSTSNIDDSWHEDWPASRYAGCTTVEGSVVVAMSNDMDLSELSCLERVTDDLLVWNNPGLVSLHGLESLLVVGGSFGLGYRAQLSAANAALASIDALGKLRVVGNDFTLDLQQPLPALFGLGSIMMVGGDLAIRAFAAPPGVTAPKMELSGFGLLASIGGNLDLQGLNGVSRITGFGALTGIGGSIYVVGATDLTELSFANLSCLQGNITVKRDYLQENTALTKIGPFTSLHRIGGSVQVQGAPNLTSLLLFDTVTSVDTGTVRISDNPLLSTAPVSALSWTGDDVVVSGNPLLFDCPFLDLERRMVVAGWTHRLTLENTATCSAGMQCIGNSCAVP